MKDVLLRVYNNIHEIIGEPLQEVFLFGSYARGDYDSESDIDIAVIIDLDREALKKYQNELIQMASEYSLNEDVLLSVCCIPKKEFEEYREALPFYRNIYSEGVRLSA